MKLGYIGLGNQGAPMAKRLADWPDGLIVFDVRTEAMTPLAELGAQLADSVADVAKADVISVTVLNDAQVRDVVIELGEHAAPGTVIAIHSTIEPGTAPELAERLAAKGVHIVDAPVSGGAGAADKGELAVMVGASEEAYAAVKPVFKKWASLVVRAGEPGAGTRMKLARNMLTFIGFAASCEAMALARRRASTCRSSAGSSATLMPRAVGPVRSSCAMTPDRWSPIIGCSTCSPTPAVSVRRIFRWRSGSVRLSE